MAMARAMMRIAPRVHSIRAIAVANAVNSAR
jgi:hypothetical protein